MKGNGERGRWERKKKGDEKQKKGREGRRGRKREGIGERREREGTGPGYIKRMSIFLAYLGIGT